MRSITLVPVAAAIALFATAARADEVTYPVQEKVFATALHDGDIVDSDVIFPGPHAVVTNTRPPLAISEEAWFPTSTPTKAAPARHDCKMVASANCTCTHG